MELLFLEPFQLGLKGFDYNMVALIGQPAGYLGTGIYLIREDDILSGGSVQ